MSKQFHPLRWCLGAFVPLALSTSAFAAGLTLTTRYGDTGGLVGNLNNVGDQVNGRNICPAANDYANGTPGCDMSADPGYQANDPGDNSDDTYNGDLLVRTNDKFEVIAAYSWLGNAGGPEERVTITGTLPPGTGFIWDDLPGACDATLSSISADRKTLTCVRVDFDTYDTGSFAEDLALPVKVEGNATNGSTPGDILLTIDTPNNAGNPITDGVEDGNSDNLIKVTAAPRWNIDKSGTSGYYTLQAGKQDDNGNPGWWIWYNFTIEVDEVSGETDSGINPRLGNEALQGGSNATVTFVDDLSNISPNAKLVTWDTNSNFNPVSNACDMDTYANSNEPYPYLNASYPDRSIPVPKNTMGVTCTQSGSQVTVTVTGIDGTLTDAPTKNRDGSAIPVNRSIAAIGVMRVFVPVTDVQNAGGTLPTKNCLKEFNPVGISGGANFGGAGESEADNCRNITLNAGSGSFGKNFRKGWSDRGDQQSEWGGGGWWLAPTDASAVNTGDGTVTPGQFFGTYAVYTNNGGTAIANPALCDVIDVETYEMVLLDPAADNPSTFVDDRIHAVDLDYSNTESVPGLTIEYATGYVGAWPPDPYEAPKANAPDEVVDECGDPSITWYSDVVTAETTDGAPVSKVRISAPSLPIGMRLSMRIKQRARANYLGSGLPIPNDTLLINHASYRSALNGNVFRPGTYIPNDASMNHQAVNAGDRLIMVRAKARITKEMDPTNLGPGGESTVTLAPSFTTEGNVPETNDVVIADLLPNGLKYKNGSTTGTYGAGIAYGEPTVISPVTDTDCNTHVPDIVAEGHPCGSLNGGTGNESILIWNLNSVATGTVFDNLQFATFVDISAPPGILENYAQISSPADSSPSSKRIANANVSNSVPTSLLIVKEVLTPQHEVNTDPLLNWMQFRVSVRNGSAIALTDLDIIDILPFNGDGVSGSFTFSPNSATTVDRQRVPATNYNGDFAFDSASFDMNGGVCSGNVEFWYTNADGPLDISPASATNAIPGGTVNWCQGDTSGPAAGCGFSKTEVTAVRTRGVGMEPGATCYLNLTYATSKNIDGDIYANTAGALATGVSNAVLSNTVSAKVFAGSIGDAVWHDANNNGVFDAGEELANVNVTITPPADVDLGNGLGVAVTTTTNASGNYLFDNLPAGEYTVAVDESSLPPALTGATNTVDPDGGNDSTSIVTLGEDEDNLDQDFAYLLLGSIGDTIYNDLDGDGVADPGEGIAGVTVTLTPPAGVDLGNGPGQPITTVTDGNGNYNFGDLPPGDYTVAVDPSTLPPALAGATNTVDPDGGNDSTAVVSLGEGENNADQDFGYLVPGSIGDTVWHDANNNGVVDSGEGIAGVTVSLTPPAGVDLGNGSGVAVTTVTDGNGNYNFGDLPPGDYTVAVDPSTLPPALAGATNTVDPDGGNDSTATVSLAQGENNQDQDFGYLLPGSIGDTIYNDLDGDGVADSGEGIAGVTVTLTPPAGVDLGNGPGQPITTVTDGNGNYNFGDLPPGDYTVAVDPSTLPPALAGATNTVDPDGGNDSTATVSLGEGENNVDQDFGYFAPGSIGDTVWHDMNNNGVLDAGEALAGVTVTLTLPGGGTQTATTNASGQYLFDNLPAGDYTVAVDPSAVLPGAINTVDPDGGNDSTSAVTLGAGEDNLDQDFAYLLPGSIGNTIYNDLNNDGVVDPGEGVDGVIVTLTPPSGVDIGAGPGNTITTTTDPAGNYSFGNLPPGDYTVAVDESTLPPALQGNNTQDPDGGNDSTATVSLSEGENNSSQNFGYFAPGTIGDTIYHDANNNGVVDPDEGIPGVTVTLELPGGGTETATTDSDGQYLFDNLPAGDYTVRVDESTLPPALQGNNTQDPDGGTTSQSMLTLTNGDSNLDQDFGYFVPGTIGDTIYHDANNNGVIDDGEGIPGVTVSLELPGGGTQTATTDNNGQYLFDNLPAGDYTVRVDESTLPPALQGNNTQDPDGGTASQSTLTLASGESNIDQNFGYFVPGTIGDTIYHDANNNGVIDDGEGIPRVTVTLELPGGGIQTVTTNSDGQYLFDNLPAGDYTVSVDESTLPPALQGNNTQDPDGGNDSQSTLTLASGESNIDQNFGYFAPAPIAASNDAYTTPVNTPVSITPLVNDTAGATITEINGVALTGNTQSIAVPNGTVEIDASGNMTFVPNPGYTGTAVFPYTISDGTNTATADVTVTITSAPIAASDDAYTTPVNTPVAITPLVNDTAGTTITEINGVRLTGGVQTIAVPNGTVEIDASGNMTFVPNPGYTGTAVFPYTISDGTNTATADVTVTITSAPIVASDDAYTTPLNTPVAITPLVNDTAGATITEINGVALTGNAQSIPVPNGTVEIDASGNMTFVPNPGYTGTAVFPYTISDGTNTATADITVTITSAPIAASDDAYTTPLNTPVVITPLVNDTAGTTITEINGVRLTGGVQTIAVPNGTVTVDAGGNLTFTPNPGFAGEASFPYTIRDGSGNTATANVTVTIPAATDDVYTTPADTPVNITPLINDQPGSTITSINGIPLTGGVQTIAVPNGRVMVDAGGRLTFTPNPGYTGTVTFPYTTRDANGNVASANVAITIAAGAPAPIPSSSIWSLLLLVGLMGLFAHRRTKKA